MYVCVSRLDVDSIAGSSSIFQAHFATLCANLREGYSNEKMFKSMLYSMVPSLHMPQFSTVQGVCKSPFYLSCFFMHIAML